jgi:hypothetical protein
MRLFGRESLEKSFKEAGFESAKLYGDECPEYGVLWMPYNAEEAPYRPLIYGLDAPPWALRKGPSDTGRMNIGPDITLQRATAPPTQGPEVERADSDLRSHQMKEDSQ